METLYVFGIRADYMQQFKEYLEEEGLPSNDTDLEELSIPVLPAIDLFKDKNLKILKVKDGVDFKKDVQFALSPQNEEALNKVNVDWYPKIQVLQKTGNQIEAPLDTRDECKLDAKHLAFLDWDGIYFELLKFKNERNWHNMSIEKAALMEIIYRRDWYVLYVPRYEMDVNSFEQTITWQEIAASLLKGYCDKFYNYKKNEYLSKFLEYQTLDITHPNFIEEYNFYIERSQEQLIEKLKALKDIVQSKAFKDAWEFSNILAFEFSRHLYMPLLHFDSKSYKDIIRVSPIQLVESEKDFVNDLKLFYETNTRFFADKELFLLRNISRKGVSFFEANNFYPDFIMWIIYNDNQYISFIDPKGLRNSKGFDDPKIKFHQVIKDDIEPRLNEPKIILNSFILTPTALDEINFWRDGKSLEDFNGHHVYFPKEQKDYISKVFGVILNA